MCQATIGSGLRRGLADWDCQTPGELIDLISSGWNKNIIVREHRHSRLRVPRSSLVTKQPDAIPDTQNVTTSTPETVPVPLSGLG